ncbi:MAG: ADP-ribosylation factor-directed GTPase activating protein isoform b [Planctomycetota bacterium]
MHGAWQIFHGILAFGRDFAVDTLSQTESALEYFGAGGICAGFQPILGDVFNDRSAPSGRGIRVDLQPDSKVGQGHRDQWLAVIAQAGVSLKTPWVVSGIELTVADWLRQAEWDVPMNYEGEFSWTLIPLSTFRPTDHRWVARDGQTWSTAELLSFECESELAESACGGTHRLIGIATAVNRRRRENKEITGPWRTAVEKIRQSIELSRVNQNPDGSYSTAYMHRSGWCRDLGEILGTTGHVLEFLAIAGDRELLRSEWVRRSVSQLCDVLDQCQGVDLECGVLYHALHGLVEYQRRASQ